YGKDIKDAISIDIDAQSIRNIILDVEGNTISILLLGEMDRASNSNSNDRNYSNSSIIMYIGSRDAGLTFSSTKVVEGLMVDDVSMLSKGRGVYIAWSEKVCADPNCSNVRIGYHFGKSNDLSYQFTVRSIN
ncbi:MAG: hypothetical protein QXS82_07300, partial [Candidatus Nitrosocaldus sp.]